MYECTKVKKFIYIYINKKLEIKLYGRATNSWPHYMADLDPLQRQLLTASLGVGLKYARAHKFYNIYIYN
jgi:hypothetical protein